MIEKGKEQEITDKSGKGLDRMLQELPSGCAVIGGGKKLELICGNEEFFRMVSFPLEEIQKMPGDFLDIVYKEDVPRLKQATQEALENQDCRGCEFRAYGKHRGLRWFAVKIRFYDSREGKNYFLISSWDIHERKLIEEELHLQTERYRLLEDINNEFPFEYDVKMQTMLLSRKFNLILLGERREEDCSVRREKLMELFHPQDRGLFWDTIDCACRKPEEGTVEYRLNVAGEEAKPEYIWYRTIYKSILGVSGEIVRILGRTKDISREKIRQDELEEQLRRDPLTGLLNKAATQEEVEGFLCEEPDGSHAMFLIDVDDFKGINDTFGHLFGDSVLVNITKKIRNLFRSNDIVGRIGGDEFLALMKHTNGAQARTKAQAICDAVKQEYRGAADQFEVSCSIGVAVYENGSEDYASLFSKSDMAMYQAKMAGKSCYQVAECMDPHWKVQRSSGIESRSSDYKAANMQDMDFLSEVVSLLSHAKDIDHSLDLLVERIGIQYNLGMVAVLECEQKKHEIYRTNCWSKRRGILEKVKFNYGSEFWKAFIQGMDETGILCVDDCQGAPVFTEEQRKGFARSDVYAMINCSFSYFDVGEGYVLFCDMEKKRKWTGFERETFQELSRLLSVFVALREKQDEDQKAIRRLKKRDLLTGLYNEEAFLHRVRQILMGWQEGMQYAVVFTDINDFSYVNDNYGHDAGNEILRSLAVMMQDTVHMVSCRLYSDLFVGFLWDKDKDVILQSVIQRSVEFTIKQREKYATGSIKLSTGIYFLESAEENLENAIENANLARKAIKGNESVYCRVYEKKLREQREIEKKIAGEFQHALAEGRMEVYIQPKFRLDEMALYGGEALVRWKKRSGKIESPGAFIPALEKSGDIVNLDFYVYEQVLAYQKKWKEAGKEPPVISVNFSRKHFEGRGIYHRVIRLAEEYEVEPEYIQIEITESLFSQGMEQVRQEMLLLRKSGFQIAIDDFGTGYSSLSMLLDIPADVVKIDRSFLDREEQEDTREFIKTMGLLIRSVKEEVIFEGIETEDQRRFLVECGFRYGQGYLFSRPLPILVFEEKYMK